MLSDEGQSGSNGLDKRHGLAEALGRIEKGEASGLVVYRFDRLARDLILQETIYQRLTAKGCQVLSVKEPEQEGDEATANMVRQMLGVVSQYERATIHGRMMAGKAAKVAEGGYGGGRPRYGMRAEGGELHANEDESGLVDQVVKLRRKGQSYRTISATLAEQGQTNRSGQPFNPNQLRRIAQREGLK